MLGPRKSVAVYHLPIVGGQKQPYPASPDATITARLLPMGVKQHALLGGDYLEPHELYCDPGADVRVSDKLVIDSVEFRVRWVFNASQVGVLNHKCAAISKAP